LSSAVFRFGFALAALGNKATFYLQTSGRAWSIASAAGTQETTGASFGLNGRCHVFGKRTRETAIFHISQATDRRVSIADARKARCVRAEAKMALDVEGTEKVL